jgi:hypothetical protein
MDVEYVRFGKEATSLFSACHASIRLEKLRNTMKQ